MYVYRLRRSRDGVGPLVPNVGKPPFDPSDMSNLEIKTRKNIGQRGMLFARVPPTLREG